MCKTCKTCFLRGTLVVDYRGNLVPIEQHKNVLVSEQDETEILKVTFSNGEIVYQSANHPLYRDLSLSFPYIGLKTRLANGSFLEIISIEKETIEPQKLYNIETIIEAFIEVGKSKIMYADAETCLKFNKENENKPKEHCNRVVELSEV